MWGGSVLEILFFFQKTRNAYINFRSRDKPLHLRERYELCSSAASTQTKYIRSINFTSQKRSNDLREREAGVLRPSQQPGRPEEGDPPFLAAAVGRQEDGGADGRGDHGGDEREVGNLHPGD